MTENDRNLAAYRAQGKKKRLQPEEELHIRCKNHIDATFPGLFYWHTANQRKSRGFTNKKGTFVPTEAVKLKAMGQKPGVADFIIIDLHPDYLNRNHPTSYQAQLVVFIELKTDLGKQSPYQKQFQEEATAKGCLYWICRSPEQVETAIRVSYRIPKNDDFNKKINKWKQENL